VPELDEMCSSSVAGEGGGPLARVARAGAVADLSERDEKNWRSPRRREGVAGSDVGAGETEMAARSPASR